MHNDIVYIAALLAREDLTVIAYPINYRADFMEDGTQVMLVDCNNLSRGCVWRDNKIALAALKYTFVVEQAVVFKEYAISIHGLLFVNNELNRNQDFASRNNDRS